jgi:hypothetical protein
MMYALRIYRAAPGRMPELHARFAEVVTGLLVRHGIVALGFWTDYVGPSNQTVTWLVQFQDVREREQKWLAMNSDPVWLAAKAKSEQNGPILSHWENRLLSPTAYSALR